MFLVYRLLPSATVETKPAMVGALVAAVLIETGKRTLGLYLENALSVRQLYGSLGLVPLFMLWVYLMWLVVLFGLEIAVALQRLAGRRPEDLEPQSARASFLDPAAVIDLCSVVHGRFTRGEPTSPEQAAAASGVSELAAELILRRLAEVGIVRRVEGAEAFLPGRPLESVPAAELLDIGFRLCDGGRAQTAESGVVAKLREAQRQALGSA